MENKNDQENIRVLIIQRYESLRKELICKQQSERTFLIKKHQTEIENLERSHENELDRLSLEKLERLETLPNKRKLCEFVPNEEVNNNNDDDDASVPTKRLKQTSEANRNSPVGFEQQSEQPLVDENIPELEEGYFTPPDQIRKSGWNISNSSSSASLLTATTESDFESLNGFSSVPLAEFKDDDIDLSSSEPDPSDPFSSVDQCFDLDPDDVAIVNLIKEDSKGTSLEIVKEILDDLLMICCKPSRLNASHDSTLN